MSLIFTNSSSWSDLVFLKGVLSKRFTVFHDDWVFMRNIHFHTSTNDYEKWIRIISFLKYNIAFVELEGMCMICKISFFFTGKVFKQSNFIDVGFRELIVFLYNLLHGLLEYLMRDTQKFAVLQRPDWRWSGCSINQGQFSETLSRAKYLNIFLLVVELDSNRPFSNYKKHSSSFPLLKNVLIRISLA